jgi:hypothetical protein
MIIFVPYGAGKSEIPMDVSEPGPFAFTIGSRHDGRVAYKRF